MDIYSDKDFIVRCIKSCTTSLHCDVILKMIGWIIVDRYSEHQDYLIVKTELMEQLIDQKMEIVKKVWSVTYNPTGEIPTLSCYIKDECERDDLKDWPDFNQNTYP